MGREKKNKPRKARPWELTALQRALATYTRDSLWSLFLAAGRSPGVRHRWASLTHLVAMTLRLTRQGEKVATAIELSALLALAHADEPSLITLEDFMPEDPRDVVHVEFGGRLYRLFGGNVERPVADLDRLVTLSAAADEVLVARVGFGLRHIAEVALDHQDRVVRAAAVTWRDGASTHEVGDADVTLDMSELIAEPQDTAWDGAHLAALTWATWDAAEIDYSPDGGMSAFGPVLRVQFPDESRPRWLPLEFVPEALAHATSTLANEAVASEPLVRRRFAQHVAARVRRNLWRFSPVVFGPPDLADGPAVSAGNVAQWMVPFGARDFLAVQLTATFDVSGHLSDVPAIVAAAEASRAGRSHVLKFATGSVTLKAGGRVIPVLVSAGAAHLISFGPAGALRCSAEDLDWIAKSARDEMDLFHFAEEMSRPDLPEIFGLETINMWDWWLHNDGALFRSGRPPSAMAFELHRGTVEWERARRLSPLERALLKLRMPPIRDWDAIDEPSAGPVQLVSWDDTVHNSPWEDGRHVKPEAVITTIHLSEAPVAMLVPPRGTLDSMYASVLFDLAGAFGFALGAIDEAWVEASSASDLVALKIELHASEGGAAAVFVPEVIETSEGVVHARLQVDLEKLGEQADQDAKAGQTLMASAFRQLLDQAGVAPDVSQRVAAAWNAAEPTLTVRLYDTMTVRNDMRAPVHLEGPLVAEVERRVAAQVRKAGVAPGTYSPEEAKRLDREALAPAALDLLRERLGDFSTTDLLGVGMVQLERILCQREHLLRSIRQSTGALALDWDPIARQAEVENEHLRLRRSAEVLIEATLLFGPSGSAPLDERAWAEALAAAAAYLDATTRSESLHYQVMRSGLEVGPLHELDIIPWPDVDGAPTAVDLGRYHLDLAAENLHQSMLDADDSAALQGLLEAADLIVESTGGVRIEDITIALVGLTGWPLAKNDPDAVAATETEIVAHLIANTIAGDVPRGEERMTAAVQALRSDAKLYAKDDWVPWRLRSRRTRLLTRPLAVRPDGRLVVAPHFCRASLFVYQGYWNAGQLPWSQAGSQQLEDALGAVRSHRNLELEQQIDHLLRTDGWMTVARVKPGDGQRLGLRRISTEIDIVAGRPGNEVIWVIEVKDPAPVFGPSDIRRQLDRFFTDEKAYMTQLSRKLDEVRVDPDAVAAALGLPVGVAYRVESIVVTRRVVPAAYAGSAHRFATAAKLLEALESPTGT